MYFPSWMNHWAIIPNPLGLLGIIGHWTNLTGETRLTTSRNAPIGNEWGYFTAICKTADILKFPRCVPLFVVNDQIWYLPATCQRWALPLLHIMFGSALGMYGSQCLNTPLTNFWHHSGAALPIVVLYYKQRRTSGIFLNVYTYHQGPLCHSWSAQPPENVLYTFANACASLKASYITSLNLF